MNRILNRNALFVLSGIGFVFLIVCFHSCISSEVIEDSPKRTIFFYMGTDTNGLDNGRTGDEPRDMINALRAGWTPGRGEMLIYTDQTNRNPCLMRIMDVRAADGLYALDTVGRYDEENSADAAVLKRVINTVVNDYPADSYGMLFFSHASGWLPAGMLAGPRSAPVEQQPIDETRLRSLVIDKGQGGTFEMEYDDFAGAIPDKQFDFIIFDACFITDVMFMYELRDKAEYVLASSAEIVSPGFTPVYKDIMRLYDTKSPVASVVAGFGQAYMDHIINSYPEDDIYCSATLGLIKMSEMQNLATTVKAALNGSVMIDESTLTVDSIQRFDRPKYNSLNLITSGQRRIRYSDFGHVMESLFADKFISDSHYAAFQEQMNRTVVWKANTKRFLLGSYGNSAPYFSEYDGFFIERHSGLSTYIEQDVYSEINAAYRRSSWYEAIY